MNAMPETSAISDATSATGEKAGYSGFRRASNIVAVASGKGGVGKTWFSITLAHALAQAGQRVLLFDGDLGLANVDVQLGLMPRRDLNDVIRGRLSMDKVIQPYEDGGFDIVAGRSGQASLSSLPGQRLLLLRDQLFEVAGQYDVVILDLGAGIDRTVRMLSACAARTLLVATDEPTSLTDAYAFIKLGSTGGMSKHVSIVINQAPSAPEGERTYKTLLKACENFLRLTPPLAGIIRHDPQVKDCIRRQTPILTRAPNADAAGDVERIARIALKSLMASRQQATGRSS